MTLISHFLDHRGIVFSGMFGGSLQAQHIVCELLQFPVLKKDLRHDGPRGDGLRVLEVAHEPVGVAFAAYVRKIWPQLAALAIDAVAGSAVVPVDRTIVVMVSQSR